MVCALLSAAAPLLVSEPATAAERIETAALMPGTVAGRETALPAILGSADAARYQVIAKLQDDAHWAAADAAIASLQDRILLGHVLAQRYLHRAYRSRYDELQEWMTHYADLPEARAIHDLALKRRPAGSHAAAEPEGAPVALRGIVDDPADLRPPARASS
jgi:hypothetical protein